MKKVIALSLIIVLCLSGCASQGELDAAYERGYEAGLADAWLPEDVLQNLEKAVECLDYAIEGIRYTNGCIADCYPEEDITDAVYNLGIMHEAMWTARDILKDYTR